MNKSLCMRQMYQPVQPAVSGAGGSIIYNELPPDEGLQEFIYCYWELKTTRPLEHAFRYRVAADGCIDIFFELDDPDKTFAMGFSNYFTEFTLDRSFNYVGIRFLPTAFSRVFRIDASELTDRIASLDAVAPKAAGFISNAFHRGTTLPQLKMAMDRYFLYRNSQAAIESDSRVSLALFEIFKRQGNIDLAKDLNIGLGGRQLRRLFHRQVGGTPKTFSRIVRFQSILNAITSRSTATAGQYLDAGYYDQSHFIREFRRLYGLAPSEASRPSSPQS